MKIIIAGYGNVGKKLTEYSIKNNYETIILSRKKIRKKNVTFLSADDLLDIKDLDNFFLISTIPPYNNDDYLLKKIKNEILKKFKKVIYISATSVYPSGIVDEMSKISKLSNKRNLRFQIENNWKKISKKVFILRSGGIYSPENNIMKRYLSSDHKLIYKKNHFINRIHIEDLVGITFEVLKSNIKSRIINAVDKKPYNTFELVKYICTELDLPKPKKLNYTDRNVTPQLRFFYEVSKIVKSVVINNELNYKFLHPDARIALLNITKDLIKKEK